MRQAYRFVIPLVALLTLTAGFAAITQEQTQEPPATKSAQDEKQESEKPRLSEQQIQALKDRLQLTDEQTPKVVALLEDDLATRQEIRSRYADAAADSKQMREELQKSRQQLFERLGEILSSSQVAEYRKSLGERRKERRQNRKSQSDPSS